MHTLGSPAEVMQALTNDYSQQIAMISQMDGDPLPEFFTHEALYIGYVCYYTTPAEIYIGRYITESLKDLRCPPFLGERAIPTYKYRWEPYILEGAEGGAHRAKVEWMFCNDFKYPLIAVGAFHNNISLAELKALKNGTTTC